MTNPAPLSTAAQAVLQAFDHARDGEYIDFEWVVNERPMLVAALRAVAEQVGPSETLPIGYAYSAPAEMWHYEFKLKAQRQILAIADELEANS